MRFVLNSLNSSLTAMTAGFGNDRPTLEVTPDLNRKVFIIVCLAVLILFTIAGNAGTLLAVFKMKSVHNSVSNLYISSLAAADMLVGMFAMTFMMLYSVIYEGRWPFGQLSCDIWMLADFITSTISLYSICAIGVDRWLNLEKPLRFFKRNKTVAKRAILAVWLVPTVLWTSVYYSLKVRNSASFAERSDTCHFAWQPNHLVLVFAVPFLYVPAALLVVMFVRISMVIRSHLQFLECHSNQESNRGSSRDLNNSERPTSRLHMSASNRKLTACTASNNNLVQRSTGETGSGFLVQQAAKSPIAKASAECNNGGNQQQFFQDSDGRLSVVRLSSPRQYERELSEYTLCGSAAASTGHRSRGPSTTTKRVLERDHSLDHSSPRSRGPSGSSARLLGFEDHLLPSTRSRGPSATSVRSSNGVAPVPATAGTLINSPTPVHSATKIKVQNSGSVATETSPLNKFGRQPSADVNETELCAKSRKKHSVPMLSSMNAKQTEQTASFLFSHSDYSKLRSLEKPSTPVRQLTIDKALSASQDSLHADTVSNYSHMTPTAAELLADQKRFSITSDTAVEFMHRVFRGKQKPPLIRASTETIIELSTPGFSGLFSTSTVNRLSVSGTIFNKRHSLNIFSDLLPCGSAISQQIRAAKAVGAISCCFVLCWLPFLVVWPLKIYCGDECISDGTYNLAILLNQCCSTINPILYALCSPRFQLVFREIFSRYKLKSRCLQQKAASFV